MEVSNLKEFNANMDAVRQRFGRDQFGLILKKIGLEALRRIVMKTPVGNPDLWKKPPKVTPARPRYVGGRARANWMVTINVPPIGMRDLKDPSGSSTVSDGAGTIASIPPEAALDTEIHITNNLPYIVALEKGHSRQAPRGMVQLTVAELNAMFG